MRAKKGKKWKYGAGFLLLFGLIVTALCLPGIFFRVQDGFINGKVSLQRQARSNVLMLGLGYEASLYRRMAKYARGSSMQTGYYIDGQTIEVTEEVQNFLTNINLWANNDLIVQMLAAFTNSPIQDCFEEAYLSARQIRQYVIYSDDYAQGVNFVLWCFTLQVSEGLKLTALIDAQDYTVYALRIRGADSDSARMLSAWVREFSRANPDSRDSYWLLLNGYYGVFDPYRLNSYFEIISGDRIVFGKAGTSAYLTLADADGGEIEIYIKTDGGLTDAEGESWYQAAREYDFCYRLPFQGNKLVFDLKDNNGGVFSTTKYSRLT